MSDISTDSFDEELIKRPLLIFSFYTHVQVECLKDIGNDIISAIDAMFAVKPTDARNLNRTYGQIWLWYLGCYEVLRTMDQAKDCFDESIQSELHSIKVRIAKIRVPFAKQEKRGKNQPVETEPSITSLTKKKDIGFTIEGEQYYYKQLYKEFIDFINSIKIEHIKGRHKDQY